MTPAPIDAASADAEVAAAAEAFDAYPRIPRGSLRSTS